MVATSGTQVTGAPDGALRYFELEFSGSGGLVRDSGLPRAASAGEFDDLFVFVHGWNTDHDSARRLFHGMFALLHDALDTYAPGRADRVATAGVLWPSKVLSRDDPLAAPGPAGAGSAEPDGSGWDEYRELLRVAFPHDDAAVDSVVERLEAQGRSASFDATVGIVEALCRLIVTGEQTQGTDLVGLVKQHVLENGEQGTGTWTFPEDMLKDLVRTLSYWQMKARAGVVGGQGLGPWLAGLGAANGDLRVHLMGHSFGARAAGFALPGAASGQRRPVRSLLLLQGAFSCLAFAGPDVEGPDLPGALPGAPGTVDGPVLATTSSHDSAVGIWYPMASRLHGPDGDFAGYNGSGTLPAEALPADRDGGSSEFLPPWTRGLGALGFRGVGAGEQDLHPVGAPYSLPAGRPVTLVADAVVGGHSDILRPQVAWAAVEAAGLVPVPALP